MFRQKSDSCRWFSDKTVYRWREVFRSLEGGFTLCHNVADLKIAYN